jgi:hypothetical protein
MRTIASIAILAATLSGAGSALAQKLQPPAKATRTEEKGWPLDMDGAIRIHNYNGTVTITGWDRDSVSIKATIAGNVGLFGGGPRTGVKTGLESGDVNSSPAADMVLFVPSRARLSIRGAATSVDIRNFAGVVDASTLSGAIHIAGPATEVTAETMDGDLTIDASPAYLRGKTATGRITWTGSSDDVDLNTVSGTVTISGSTLHRARIESISGDLKFSGTLKPAGRVTFDTHGGDITAVFTGDTRADLTADAPSGSVLGTEFKRMPGKGPYSVGVPRGVYGKPAVRPSDLILRSFKGRVTVTQPEK